MEKIFNTISFVFGVIGGFIAKWLGGWDALLITIVALAVLGYKGLLKKIVMFIVIAVAFIIQRLISDVIPLREVVIMFYVCNEALSLLENAAEFVPIPDKLKNTLLQLRDKNNKEDNDNE